MKKIRNPPPHYERPAPPPSPLSTKEIDDFKKWFVKSVNDAWYKSIKKSNDYVTGDGAPKPVWKNPFPESKLIGNETKALANYFDFLPKGFVPEGFEIVHMTGNLMYDGISYCIELEFKRELPHHEIENIEKHYFRSFEDIDKGDNKK